MKINAEIAQEAFNYVSEYLDTKLSNNFCYHNILHTICLVNAIQEISEGMELSQHDKYILITAAWFHDIGYIWQIEDHETISAGLADNFLHDREIDAEDILKVRNCILATRYPQKPATVMEAVICDADMIHLGDKDFLEKNTAIREEWRLTRQLNYTDKEWYRQNIDFVKNHSFHTSYCRKNYNRQKEKNIKAMIKLAGLKKGDQQNGTETDVLSNKKNLQKEKSERGIETFFKTASRNHMQLSSMADSKAHILLTINSIIISLVISVLSKRIEQSSYLLFPTSLLLCVCLTTVVFAVLTTQPKISRGIFTEEQVAKREANLMFFGNFHRMKLETFEWGVKEIMNDKEYLYNSLTRDVYFLGKVLAIKYRYLNIGYKVFMFGLIASVLSFGISFYCAN